MSALVHGHFAPQSRGGLLSHAVAAVTGAIGHLAHEWRVRRDTLALSELGESALHDIGIGRGFEEEAVRHGRGHRGRNVALRAVPVGAMPVSHTEWR